MAAPKGVLKKTSKAAPIAIGEMTMGRSSRLSTRLFPKKLFLEMA